MTPTQTRVNFILFFVFFPVLFFKFLIFEIKREKNVNFQEKVEWIEEPVDRQIKQGTVDEVRFTAKLSAKGKKAKWYMRNAVGSLYILVENRRA